MGGRMGEPTAPAPSHAGFGPELRIDWIAARELDGSQPGRLGLTFLPGKRGASQRYPGHTYRRDTSTDLTTMHADGVVRLVLLVEDGELGRWGDPRIVELGTSAGVEVRRFPIADGAAPASTTEMDAILDAIDEGRAAGDVAVACMGGVGRSGMVAACALVRAGSPPAEAIARVRSLRHPTAVETVAQERFVNGYARGRGAGGG
jgi:protein-tyrosine phosphatase